MSRIDTIIVTNASAGEITALAVALQERQTSEIAEKVIDKITESLDQALSSIPVLK